MSISHSERHEIRIRKKQLLKKVEKVNDKISKLNHEKDLLMAEFKYCCATIDEWQEFGF